MKLISSLTIPVVLLFVILFAFFKKVKVYDCFIDGAKNGLTSSFKIAAPLVGLISAISIFRASGAMDIICRFLEPVAKFIRFPKEVLPLVLIKPISGSGALAMLSDIFKIYKVDNFIGAVASVVSGSAETIFYTIAVYFGAVEIKNIRYTAKAALIADLTCVLISALVVRITLGM